MMKIWQWTLWCILVALFLLNQYVERVLHIHIFFFYSYFDDLLAVPVTLGTYQILMTDVLRKSSFRVTLPIVLTCITGFIFHFEVLLPRLSEKYIYDPLDVFMYVIGGLFYLFTYSIHPIIPKKSVHL